MIPALCALIAALAVVCALHVVCLRQWAAERRTLLAAVMSRHAGEFAAASPAGPAPGRARLAVVDREDEPTEHEMIGVGGL